MLTGKTQMDWLHSLEAALPWLALLLVGAITLLAFTFLVIRLLNMQQILRQKIFFSRANATGSTDKTQEATQRLFAVVHGLKETRPWQDKLMRRRVAFSLEVVSTGTQGICYIVRVAEHDASIFEQSVVSYVPDVRLRRVGDYLPDSLRSQRSRLLEFKQIGHFVYPLQTQDSLSQHDPIAYLTGSMTKLAPSELIAIQLVVSPVKVREADALSKRISNNEELLYNLGRQRLPILKTLTNGLNSLLFGVLDNIGEINTPTRGLQGSNGDSQRKREVAIKVRPARSLTSFEQQLAEAVHDKLS